MPWLAVSRLSFTSTIKWRQIIYIIKLFYREAERLFGIVSAHNTVTNLFFSYILSWIKCARMQSILRLCKMRFALAAWALMRYHETKKFSFKFSRTFPLFSMISDTNSFKAHEIICWRSEFVYIFWFTNTANRLRHCWEKNIHFVEIFFSPLLRNISRELVNASDEVR